MDDSIDDVDPLELRKLAVAYEYLLFKIDGRVSDLAALTKEAVDARGLYAENVIKALDIDKAIERLDCLINSCRKLESELLKIQQWKLFVADFDARISALESIFGA